MMFSSIPTLLAAVVTALYAISQSHGFSLNSIRQPTPRLLVAPRSAVVRQSFQTSIPWMTSSTMSNRHGRSRSVTLRASASGVGESGDDSANEDDESIKKPELRPEWACDWMPSWLVTMRPALQLLVGMALYIFHLTVLTQHGIAFPVQLIPNDKGRFQSIGLDSLAGIVSFVGLLYLRTATKKSKTPAVPSLWSNPSRKDAPWKFPKRWKKATPFSPRVTSVVALVLLVNAYFITGRFALFWEDSLYALAGIGVPMTIAMHRSLCVLMGHLTWVVSGSAILKIVLSPQPFFGGGRQKIATDDDEEEDDDADSVQRKKKKTPIQKWRWYSSKWDTYWLWWTIGGYFVSSWLFNIADFLNQVILPPFIFEEAAEGVVSQLINPENNDLLASLVGYIAPCMSAPWWEEVLYRGFLLPALCLFMNFWSSVFFSGIIFSAHHLSVTGAIPLAILGWVWAVIYAKSGNLLVTIMIHAMWNSRVFLGSWLGL